MHDHLKQLRELINKIDEEIAGLFSERFDITHQIGEYKKTNNLPIQDPQREAELYVKLKALSEKYDISLEMLTHIYEYLINHSRKDQV